MSVSEEQTTPPALSGDELELRLRAIRASIGKVHHDLNNPLSIITGNAQLFLEIAKMVDLEEDLVQPVRDIEEASYRMATLLQRLVQLKDMIPTKVEDMEEGA